MIYLQKFAIHLGGIPPLSLPLLIMLASLVYMALKSQLRISPVSLVIYGLLVAAVLFSHLGLTTPFSLPSLVLLLVTSGLFVVSWHLDWNSYRSALSKFLNMMILPACMVFAQIAWHAVTGYTLSLERLVPKSLLMPGFLYEAPIRYGSSFIRPNGFFMLEPSFISLLLGAAILVDIMYFLNVRRLMLLVAALLACMAATGMVLLAVASPFLFLKQSLRSMRRIIVIGLVAVIATMPLGIPQQMLARVDELNSNVQESSGGGRLIVPAQQLGILLGDPDYLLSGQGAGQLEANTGSAWPMLKLAQEYGLLVMTIYMLLFIVSVARCPNLPLAVGLFVFFNFTGGYLLVPAALEAVLLLCTICSPVGPNPLPEQRQRPSLGTRLA